MLISCHTPGYDEAMLCRLLLEAFGGRGSAVGQSLVLRTAAGRELPSGVAACWQPGTEKDER